MTQEPQKNSTVLVIIAIIGVIGTIIASAIGAMGNYNIEKMRQEAELTRIALVSIATQGGATQRSMANTISASTSTPYPTNEPLPTYTSYPTYTPVPFPTIHPTPSIPLPFSDNFDNGINSNWKEVTGTWRTVNGRLIADNTYSEIIVGDENWKNYIVEVDVFSKSAAGWPVGVIVRLLNGKSLMFKTDCCNTHWILFDGVTEETIASIDEGGLDFSLSNFTKNHIRVEVIDQVFTGYIDGKLFLQVTDSTIPTGAVGLMSQTPHENRLLFDNFIVTLP